MSEEQIDSLYAEEREIHKVLMEIERAASVNAAPYIRRLMQIHAARFFEDPFFVSDKAIKRATSDLPMLPEPQPVAYFQKTMRDGTLLYEQVDPKYKDHHDIFPLYAHPERAK